MGHMGQVGHFKMTHLYHPPFQMDHPSRGVPLDAYPKPEPTCYQPGGSRLGINFELPGKSQLFAHYSFLSHLEMHGDEEIAVHFKGASPDRLMGGSVI